MGGQNRAPQHSFRYERIIFVYIRRIPSMEDMLILGSKQCFLKSCNIESPFTYLTMVWSAATKPSAPCVGRMVRVCGAVWSVSVSSSSSK